MVTSVMRWFFWFLLATGFVILTGCKKDEDNKEDENPAADSFRIIEELLYNNAVEDSKEVYEYADNKISTVTTYDFINTGVWEKESKQEYSYPAATVVEIITSQYAAGNWEQSDKDRIVFSGGKWQEFVSYYFDGLEWKPSEKSDYTYTDGRLSELTQYDYVGGTEIAVIKSDYQWIDDKVVAATNYAFDGTQWNPITKDTAFYDADQIIKTETYSFAAGKYITRHIIAYAAEKTESVSIYNLDFQGTWNLAFLHSFTYDMNGLLSEYQHITDFMGVDKTLKTVYSYEKGMGNYKQIWDSGNGWNSWIPAPTKKGDFPGKAHLSAPEADNFFGYQILNGKK